MRFAAFKSREREGLAVAGSAGEFRGLYSDDANYPGSLDVLIHKGDGALERAAGALRAGDPVDLDEVKLLPPLAAPAKIICVGLNYLDHSLESGFTPPSY